MLLVKGALTITGKMAFVIKEPHEQPLIEAQTQGIHPGEKSCLRLCLTVQPVNPVATNIPVELELILPAYPGFFEFGVRQLMALLPKRIQQRLGQNRFVDGIAWMVEGVGKVVEKIVCRKRRYCN